MCTRIRGWRAGREVQDIKCYYARRHVRFRRAVHKLVIVTHERSEPRNCHIFFFFFFWGFVANGWSVGCFAIRARYLHTELSPCAIYSLTLPQRKRRGLGSFREDKRSERQGFSSTMPRTTKLITKLVSSIDFEWTVVRQNSNLELGCKAMLYWKLENRRK